MDVVEAENAYAIYHCSAAEAFRLHNKTFKCPDWVEKSTVIIIISVVLHHLLLLLNSSATLAVWSKRRRRR